MSTVHLAVLAAVIFLGAPAVGMAPMNGVYAFMACCFLYNLLTNKHIPK